MDFATNSIIGKRDNQEDYGVIKTLSSTEGVLAVISDGMGGQVAGEIASSTVVDSFVASFNSSKSKNLPLRLKVALEKSNQNLARSVKANPKLDGMGATLVAVHIDSQGMLWTSVGDSILFLFRNNKITRLNEDHSMTPVLQDSVRKGQLSESEARSHPHRNALRSALTGEDISLIDLTDEFYVLQEGDIVLLASDGLLTLTESEVGSILNKCRNLSADEIVNRLLQSVNAVGKPRQDNTLIQIVKISGRKASKFWLLGIIGSLVILLSILTGIVLSFDKIKELITANTGGQNNAPVQVIDKSEVKPFQLPVEVPQVEQPSVSPVSPPITEPGNSKKSPPNSVSEKQEPKVDKKSSGTPKGVKAKEAGGSGDKMWVKPASSEDSINKQEVKPATPELNVPTKAASSEVAAPLPSPREDQKSKTDIVYPPKDAKVDSVPIVTPSVAATEIEKPKVIPVEDRSVNKKSE